MIKSRHVWVGGTGKKQNTVERHESSCGEKEDQTTPSTKTSRARVLARNRCPMRGCRGAEMAAGTTARTRKNNSAFTQWNVSRQEDI